VDWSGNVISQDWQFVVTLAHSWQVRPTSGTHPTICGIWPASWPQKGQSVLVIGEWREE